MRRLHHLAVITMALAGVVALADESPNKDKKADPPANKDDIKPFREYSRCEVGNFDGKKFTFNLLGAGGKKIPLTLDLADSVKVRISKAALGKVYDDKGNLRDRTEAELKEMKAPDWEYLAELEQVRPGQLVRVFVGKRSAKDAPPLVTAIYIVGQKVP